MEPWSAHEEAQDEPEPVTEPWSAHEAEPQVESDPQAEPEIPADQAYAAAPGGAEPYGSEVPPLNDESSATAYDAQLARDEAASSSVIVTDDAPTGVLLTPYASPGSDDEHVSTPAEDTPAAARLR